MPDFHSSEYIDSLKQKLNDYEEELASLKSQLRSLQERHKMIFDNLGDEVHLWKIIRNSKGQIKTWQLTDANPAALKNWKRQGQDVFGKTVEEIFDNSAITQFMPIVVKLFSTNESVSWEHFFEPTGQILKMNSIPMGDYFISIGRDITHEKNARQNLIESERRFKSVFKKSPAANILTNREGGLIDANNKACDLFGYSRSELLGMTTSSVFKDGQADVSKGGPLMSTEGDSTGQISVTRQNGDTRIVEFHTIKIAGNLYFSKLIDITDQVQNESAKRKAEEQLRRITNSVPGTIYQFKFNQDGTYSIPFMSQRAEDLLGYELEKMQNTEFLFSRIHPEDYPRTLESILEANADNALWSAEYRALNSNNEIVWIKAQSKGMRNDEGEVVHSGVFLDITNQKIAEQELHTSRQKYQNIAESLPGIVLRYRLKPDNSDELVSISGGVEELYEVSHNKAIENNSLLWERVHKDDVQAYQDSIHKSAKELSLWEYEHRLQMPDGRIKWVYMKGTPKTQIDGSIVWDSIGLDITKQKKAEAELAHLNENLEALVEERTQKAVQVSKELELYWLAAEHSKSGVWQFDIVNNILEWDDIMYELYGVNKADFSGAYDAWETSLHPDDKERTVEELNEAIEKKSLFDSLFRVIHPDTGKVSYIRGKGKVLVDEKGKATAVYGTNWDVTREMQLADERENALNNLRETQSQLIQSEKMASLGVLTAGVAHEINNPLNYIHGGYTAIQQHIQDSEKLNKAEIAEYLEWIKTGTERASGIVKSLNIFSRQTNKRHEKCDLHEIIDDCLLILRNQYKDRKTITKRYCEEQPLLAGNNGQLHQAILNLLQNAIDAIAGEGEIIIETKVTNSTVSCIISDNGVGISEENLKKITDPFFTTKPPGKGTGLGLSITQSIVAEHSGNLAFTSEPQKGTTFRVELPLNFEK